MATVTAAVALWVADVPVPVIVTLIVPAPVFAATDSVRIEQALHDLDHTHGSGRRAV